MVCTENDFIFGVYSNVHKYLYMYVCDHRKARRIHTEMLTVGISASQHYMFDFFFCSLFWFTMNTYMFSRNQKKTRTVFEIDRKMFLENIQSKMLMLKGEN